MNEKERLRLRAKMLAWNRGSVTMGAVLDEFKKDENTMPLAAAFIGGSCARLLELGYDYFTINALLAAQATSKELWKELHRLSELRKPKIKKKR